MILCRAWVLEDSICALMLRPSYFVVIHERIAGTRSKRLRRANCHLSCKKKTATFTLWEVAATGATGFEPAISALTGLHVRPLHHAPTHVCSIAYLAVAVKSIEPRSRAATRLTRFSIVA